MDNGVFGTGLSFVQLIVALVVFFGGIIAVKITFNFDINKYLEARQKSFKAKCQNACLHFEFIKNSENQIEARSFFVSPSGTLNHICQKCGLVRLHIDRDEFERQCRYYLENFKAYEKRNKKFNKLLKKAGQV